MPTHSGITMPILPPSDPDSDNQAYYEAEAGAASEYLVLSTRVDRGVDIVVAPPDPGDGTDFPLLFRVFLPYAGEVTFLRAGTPHDAIGRLAPGRDAILLKFG